MAKSTVIQEAQRFVKEHLSGNAAIADKEKHVEDAAKQLAPLIKAVREAEQITADDRRVYINARATE